MGLFKNSFTKRFVLVTLLGVILLFMLVSLSITSKIVQHPAKGTSHANDLEFFDYDSGYGFLDKQYTTLIKPYKLKYQTSCGQYSNLENEFLTCSGINNNIYILRFIVEKDSFPGHVYIRVDADDDVRKECLSEGYGKNPTSHVKAASASWHKNIRGYIKDEGVPTGKNYDIFSIALTACQYYKLEAEVQDHRLYDKEYNLIDNNCVIFVGDIAKKIGLKIPSNIKMMLPSTFFNELLRLNHNIISLQQYKTSAY